jgi:hypothetical protein
VSTANIIKVISAFSVGGISGGKAGSGARPPGIPFGHSVYSQSSERISPCRLTTMDLIGTCLFELALAPLASASKPIQHGTCIVITVSVFISASSNNDLIFSA